MAETPVIKAEERKEFGKGASRRLRRDGRLPGVLYASHQEPVHFHADLIEVQALIRRDGVNAVLALDMNGEEYLAIVKVIDQNILTLDIDHLDLQAVKRGEKVEVEVSVLPEGEIHPDAMLIQELDTILVEADALNIPEEITVSVEGLEAGEQILAGDITLPDGVTLIQEAEDLVINVTHEEVAEIPEDDEEAAEGEEGAAPTDDAAEEESED